MVAAVLACISCGDAGRRRRSRSSTCDCTISAFIDRAARQPHSPESRERSISWRPCRQGRGSVTLGPGTVSTASTTAAAMPVPANQRVRLCTRLDAGCRPSARACCINALPYRARRHGFRQLPQFQLQHQLCVIVSPQFISSSCVVRWLLIIGQILSRVPARSRSLNVRRPNHPPQPQEWVAAAGRPDSCDFEKTPSCP